MAKAQSDRKLRFTALAHLLTPEFLLETWGQMNRRGASGVDGETAEEFEGKRSGNDVLSEWGLMSESADVSW